MAIANLLLRFLLELGAIAAASWSGYTLTPGAGPVRWLIAAGAALAVILVWAVVVAPTRRNGLSAIQKERIGTAIMLTTGASLALSGEASLAIIFGALILLNAALLVVLGRDALDHLKGVPA
ncbi:MAG: DUF2568 domain-containing protein [Chloroflexota bacterium]